MIELDKILNIEGPQDWGVKVLKPIDVNEAKQQLTRLIIEKEAQARYDERFKILNFISMMRLDISREAIKNGRVEIMKHIAERLRHELK